MTSKSKTTPPAPPVVDNGTSQNNLYVSVKTFEAIEGRCVGERIVDMCHYNTRNWLQKHLWWATHNGHGTEINVATPEEIDAYLASGKAALAAKFNATAPESLTEAA